MPAAAGSHHRDSLAGLTLDDVLANRAAVAAAAAAAAASSNHLPSRRTLLDIIREDESNKKDRKSWKAFKDKLRLKRAGSAWTSSILIPASDISIPIHIQNFTKSSPQDESEQSPPPPLEISPPVLTLPPSSGDDDDDTATHHMADKGYDEAAPTVTRQGSTRLIGDTRMIGDASYGDKLKPQMSRPNSARLAAAVRADSIRRERVVTFRDDDDDEENDEDGRALRSKSKGEHRQMSAREAVAAQEAAEAAAAKAYNNDEGEEEEEYDDEDDEDESGNGGGGMTMSLMDLLEETDRQMGLEGSRYRMEDDDDEIEDDEIEDDEEDEGGIENDCCVCMVKHKGPAFVPCGHAFCRMCSRELTVTKGNCPLCNNFILEILDIF